MTHATASILLTCEHGGNQIPKEYQVQFKNSDQVLNTHRGLDIGVLEIAKLMQKQLQAPFIYSTTSRLVADLNRTLNNPTLFSEFMQPLAKTTLKKVLAKYYLPHWAKVRKNIRTLLHTENRVVHVAVHSMTAQLNGQKRKMHLALLYNPAFKNEVGFSSSWIKELRKEFPDYIIARNKPYRGDGDGLTCEMRKENKPDNYIGLEIELNQGMLLTMTAKQKAKLATGLARSLDRAVKRYPWKNQ